MNFHVILFATSIITVLVSTASCGKIKREVHSSGCPKNSVYKECTNFCPDKSCQNIQTVSSCFSLRCGPPACMCKEGHVYLDGNDKNKGCVSRETCNKLNKLRDAHVL
ncbi:TIL domain-containing protein [Caenorhabditis elegans]|uniref:TIL domain-containing protein n=1 Tax=Caenorhabditis elegans TaxID=6239 RepID=G4S7A1_CAEEL|nr:TIL domain-containing protein [Caenorhabditis elegans]CCD67199.2 TIL domain-containing protein [Caenorhabditis elegans]|eukprot:NP_001256994.2 Uncharacterized protein CELE_F47G3.4 [Caenorhabditis elegans]